MYLVDIFNILADTFWSLTEEFCFSRNQCFWPISVIEYISVIPVINNPYNRISTRQGDKRHPDYNERAGIPDALVKKQLLSSYEEPFAKRLLCLKIARFASSLC